MVSAYIITLKYTISYILDGQTRTPMVLSSIKVELCLVERVS